ncbi:LysR family transcriptional regulator [Levilactobacillus suantsaii]|uniref:LysR family transcriptional regulator n=1 Tax=Levilactobacillus suantsaii TaxID=2292255 RepID=A0A4Q0VIB5_9LACO|nr:LysR family transcriptional regulator [Levilactobacillus suantsaii]RXI77918.1 LysR family transcriptional regulator [Levilactobacillus suantsaii]
MNSLQLKCLLSVGQTKSVTQTATQLYVSQSTVSKNLKRLETELGFKIIAVHAHQTDLTPEGHYLYTHLQQLAAQFNQVLEHIYADKASRPITVCHSIIPFERVFLPAFFHRFTAQHNRPIQLSSFRPAPYAASLNLLLNQQATFILMQEDFFHADPRIAFTPLLRGHYSVIIPRDQLLTLKSKLSLTDLAQHKLWIWNSTPPVHSAIRLSNTLRQTLPNLELTTVKNIAECAMYAASGEGLGLIPGFAIDPQNTDVVYRPLDLDIPMTYGVSYLRATKQETYFTAIIDALQATVADKQATWF